MSQKAQQVGECGRAIFETAKASVDHSRFAAAWRHYENSTNFRDLPQHDRALIRVAFVSGWRAAMTLPHMTGGATT